MNLSPSMEPTVVYWLIQKRLQSTMWPLGSQFAAGGEVDLTTQDPSKEEGGLRGQA